MSRWWSKKYNLPSNHELFQSETLFYWLTEYYQDYFEAHPLEVYRKEDGEIQFTDTGDELVDAWEEQLARGEIPDLTQAFSKEALDDLKNRKKKPVLAESMSIADTFKTFEAERIKNEELLTSNTTKKFGPTFKGA